MEEWRFQLEKLRQYIIVCFLICPLLLYSCTYQSNTYQEKAEKQYIVELIPEFTHLIDRNGTYQLTVDDEKSIPIESITYNNDRIIASFTSNGINKCVLFNMEGEMLSESYASIELLQGNENGYFVIESKSKYGIMDSEGQVTIPPEYDFIGDYSEGVFRFALDNKYGYMDLRGNIEIAAKFNYYQSMDKLIFCEGVALVQGDKPSDEHKGMISRKGVINRKGEFIVSGGYDGYALLNNGYIIVLKGERDNGYYADLIEPLWGLYDNKGNSIIEPVYRTRSENAHNWFVEPVIPMNGEMIEYSDSLKTGLVNLKGKIQIEAAYEYIYPFQEGFSVVIIGNETYNGGYIDANGNLLGDRTWAGCYSFSEGLGAVVSEDGRIGYVDSSGELNIPQIYRSAGDDPSFHEGLAAVSNSNHQSGFINKEGKWVISPTNNWDFTSGFKNGRAIIKKNTDIDNGHIQDKSFGLIDKSGAIVLPIIYEEIVVLNNQFYRVKYNEKYGCFDRDGTKILDVKYDMIENVGEELMVSVRSNNGGNDKIRYRVKVIDRKRKVILCVNRTFG